MYNNGKMASTQQKITRMLDIRPPTGSCGLLPIYMSNSLATSANKFSRHLELTNVCPLCGMEREDGFHAMCRCPLAVELWRAMAWDWPIPTVESVINTGPEWLFSLLEPLSDTMRMVLLMIMWRMWYMHNEITHGKIPPPPKTSRRFLQGYINALLCIHQWPHGNMVKGKMAVQVGVDASCCIMKHKEELRWLTPCPGWTKLNVDGSYVPATGEAGGGMVLRLERGEIIFTACREIRSCDNSLDVELAACREGLELALDCTDYPIVVEMDNTKVVMMLNARSVDRSRLCALVTKIQRMIADDPGEILVTTIRRSQNKVSHALVVYGRSTPRTAVWLGSGMSDIAKLAVADWPP